MTFLRRKSNFVVILFEKRLIDTLSFKIDRMLVLLSLDSAPQKNYSRHAYRENKFREFRENPSTAKISSVKLAHFDPSNRENVFRENLYPRKFVPLRYL